MAPRDLNLRIYNIQCNTVYSVVTFNNYLNSHIIAAVSIHTCSCMLSLAAKYFLSVHVLTSSYIQEFYHECGGGIEICPAYHCSMAI